MWFGVFEEHEYRPGKDGHDVPGLQFEIVFLILLEQCSAQVEGLEGGREIVGIQPLDNRVVPIDLRHSLINAIGNRKRSEGAPVCEAMLFPLPVKPLLSSACR